MEKESNMTSNQLQNDRNKIEKRQTQINQQLADQDLRKTQALEKQARVAVATAPAKYIQAVGKLGKMSFRPNSSLNQMKNGIEFYTNELDATKVVSNLSFNQPYGTPLHVTPVCSHIDESFNGIPGALTVSFVPWFGTTNVKQQESAELRDSALTLSEYIDQFTNSAVNLAAYNMYAYVRYANSGNRNYEKADMASFILAASTIYPGLASIFRALRVLRTFKFSNRVYGAGLWKALGFDSDFDSECAKFNDYVAQFNILLLKANIIRMPKDLSIIKKWNWMCSNIFKDDDFDGFKGQIIVPVMAGQYLLDSQERYIALTKFQYDALDSLTALIEKVSLSISRLTQSESFAIMMGDILKAYGEDKLLSFQAVSIDDISPIEATYDQEMFMQLSNASLPTFEYENGKTSWQDIVIKQDNRAAAQNTGNIYPDKDYSEEFNEYHYKGAITPICIQGQNDDSVPDWVKNFIFNTLHNPILNAHTDQPSSDDVIYMTRMQISGGYKLAYDDDKFGVYHLYVDSCGTEIIARMNYITSTNGIYWNRVEVPGYSCINGTGKEISKLKRSEKAGTLKSVTPSDAWNMLKSITDRMAFMSTFNIAPRTYYFFRSTQNMRYWNSFGSWENPVNFSSVTLDKIHTPCVYSELTIPGATGLSTKSNTKFRK